MKFVNATMASHRCHADLSHHPYGRKEIEKHSAAPPPPAPEKPNRSAELEAVLKNLKPEPKARLEGKLIKMAMMPSPDKSKKEAEDILAILRSLK